MLPRTCSGHLYDVLDLPQDCSTEAVKRQYRVLALRYHPDRTNGETTEQFKDIEEAHRVLSDPEQRQLYDTFGRERMKMMGEYVPDFLRTVSAVRGILTIVSVIFGLCLLSLVLVAVKVDSGSRLSWWTVLFPLWVIFPFVFFIGVLALSAGLRQCSVEMVLVGAEAMLSTVIAIAATAALSGRLRPVSRAVVPWVVWYTLRSLRHFWGLIPQVYARAQRDMQEMARQVHRAAAANSGGDVDPVADDDADSIAVASVGEVCRSRAYWGAWGQQLLEFVCVVSFLALVFERANQAGGVGAATPGVGNSPSSSTAHLLSIWTVVSPLLVYYGICSLRDAVIAALSLSPPSSSSNRNTSFVVEADNGDGETDAARGHHHNNHGGAYNSRHSNGAASLADDSDSSQTCCVRVIAALLGAIFPHGCFLYVACMWAAKLEVEVNGRKGGMHPSTYVATFPLFLVLAFLTVVSCCASCLLGLAVRAGLQGNVGGGGDQPYNNNEASAACGPSQREGEGSDNNSSSSPKNYQSCTTQKAVPTVDCID